MSASPFLAKCIRPALLVGYAPFALILSFLVQVSAVRPGREIGFAALDFALALAIGFRCVAMWHLAFFPRALMFLLCYTRPAFLGILAYFAWVWLILQPGSGAIFVFCALGVFVW